MTLEPQSWLPAAQQLPLNGRRRVDHDCGTGRTMIVGHTVEGWNAYCWRCSLPGFHPAPQPSLAERIARLTAVQTAEAEAQRDTRPPTPANFDPSTWPLEARVWLYKAGLSNDDIREHGFYHCGRLSRVVMPVCDTGRVVYWQARGFERGRPKYINPPVDRSSLAPLYGAISLHGARGPGLLVLTEDILSAIRASAIAPSRSLMGTALTDTVLLMVKAHQLPVSVWLDPDAAGRRASSKIVKQLRNYGIDARAIRTERDPKYYSKEEIAQYLLT